MKKIVSTIQMQSLSGQKKRREKSRRNEFFMGFYDSKVFAAARY